MSREILRGLLVPIVFLAALAVSAGAYSGGSGNPNNPYQIANVADFNQLTLDPNNWDKSFILTEDINLSAYTGTQYKPIGNFTKDFNGIFDGDGHVIRGLTYTATAYVECFGLFGRVVNATIKNLGLEDVNIYTNAACTGGLVGMQYYGTVASCYCSGTISAVSSLRIGMLVGYIGDGNVSYCHSEGSINVFMPLIAESAACTGGLVGRADEGNIIFSSSNCSITVNGQTNPSHTYCTGGLVGQAVASGAIWCSIISCHSTGPVTTYVPYDSEIAGGLVGCFYGTVSYSFSSSPVNGTSYYSAINGGLIGWQAGGSAFSCYSTGDVNSKSTTAAYAGGLVGEVSIPSSTISSCYSMGNSVSTSNNYSGYSYAGGLVGYGGGFVSRCYSTGRASAYGHYTFEGGLIGIYGSSDVSFWDINTSGLFTSADGTGKTTVEMKTLSTFTSATWDFSYTDGDSADWFMPIDGYPILTWQISPADLYTDGKNNFRDFAILAKYWHRKDCAIYNDYCEWTDMNLDGHVDISDLADFVSYWLEEGIY